MAVLPLLIAPDPRLKLVSQPVARVDQRIQRLMDDMLETMYDLKGLGLAAPQVAQLRDPGLARAAAMASGKVAGAEGWATMTPKVYASIVTSAKSLSASYGSRLNNRGLSTSGSGVVTQTV